LRLSRCTRPGSVARILKELEAEPDAVLCATLECDLQLKPLCVRSWFEDPEGAPAVWRLQTREDLAAYFNSLRFMGGAFSFISSAVLRRQRFLANERGPRGIGVADCYVHVYYILPFLLAPTVLHWVREPMLMNRTGNDPNCEGDPYYRACTMSGPGGPSGTSSSRMIRC